MWNVQRIKAETAEEIEQIQTPTGIRKRLWEVGYRNDPIVSRIFDLARHEGLSGEDTYTLLAYYALADRERLEQLLVDFYNSKPPELITIPKGEGISGGGERK